MGYRYVWFDLGLTLVKSPVEKLYAQVLRRFDIEKDEDDIRRAFYLTDKTFMREYPRVLGADPAQFMPWYLGVLNYQLGVRLNLSACCRHYIELGEQAGRRWQAVPGAAGLLEELRRRGIGTGLISNWNHTCRDVLAENGLDRLLDVIVVSSEVGYEKPDARIFEAALQAAHVAPEECLYVGDNYYDDAVGARNAGIQCLLISPYGTLGMEEITHDATISNIKEVIRHLDQK